MTTALLCAAIVAAGFGCPSAPPATSPRACAGSASATSASSAPSTTAVVAIVDGAAPTTSSSAPEEPPPFPSRLIERSSPSMQLRTPIFSFPSDAANTALEAVFEKKAAEQEQAFLKAYRSPAAKDSQGAYMRWTCAPTLVRPRLASVRCEGAGELVGVGAWLMNDGETFAVDGAKVRAMKPREFFVPDKPGADGFSARATAALQGVVDACSGGFKVDTKKVDASIKAFTVDEKGVTLIAPELGCSASGFEGRIAWDDVKELIDPKGGIGRVKE